MSDNDLVQGTPSPGFDKGFDQEAFYRQEAKARAERLAEFDGAGGVAEDEAVAEPEDEQPEQPDPEQPEGEEDDPAEGEGGETAEVSDPEPVPERPALNASKAEIAAYALARFDVTFDEDVKRDDMNAALDQLESEED